ncbi:hypothetical protein QNH98_14760 [Myroides sp. mNGS23_01]|nr:hypothetical protein [Myroides sp. mNGS23_01]WHT38292.1 hypothetical protein QNH98_14760 [Myroides sp. mNGS23_01]
MHKPLSFLAVASFLAFASCQDKKEEPTAPEVTFREEKTNTTEKNNPILFYPQIIKPTALY